MMPEGVMLAEIAPGINLEEDVLDKMGFRPIISDTLGIMDLRIFRDEPMKLKDEKFK